MSKPPGVALALALVSSTCLASNCDEIRSHIEAKIRASGVSAFTLVTIEAQAPAAGRVVGTCALGTRKIVYVRGNASVPAASASAPASTAGSRPVRDAPMLTECKDGTVSLGGTCGTQRTSRP
jgi:hypothetical protein